MSHAAPHPLALLFSAGLLAAAVCCSGCHRSQLPNSASKTQPVTFAADVAPVLFRQCAACHRPGGSGPFSLLTYTAASKHAREIVRVTQARTMPPWLPEPGYGDFLDERRLSTNEIALLQRWVEAGAPEGNPAQTPAPPQFTDGWQLGEPDLEVQMPEPYPLAAEGKDLYRNFVIPVPNHGQRYVEAVEFHPGNKSVHHVRILLDSTGQSRRLESQDGQPGFGGMNVPAKFPPGHMLTWVPGKRPTKERTGMAWVWEADADLVLQIHMQRTGKTELIQPTLGLFFTDQPPTQEPCRIGLLSELIDIPPGESNYVVEREFELPADVEVLAVLPHLHYLGKELQAYATVPSGGKQWLLWIKQWDFNWQSEYQYRQPVFLPKGATIHMHYTYDNSAENPRNPNHPVRRVAYGPESVDEMGELWLQLLPRYPGDLPVLQAAHRTFSNRETVAYYQQQLRADPNNPVTHLALGKVLGPLGQLQEALQEFQTAVQLEPKLVEAHYYLGLSYYSAARWPEAQAEFQKTTQLSPTHVKAHDGLGLVALKEDKPAEAAEHFREALRLSPNDPVARHNLDQLGTSHE